MGFTNSVQPYCRFAIITMQMMPMMSWVQRALLDGGLLDWEIDAGWIIRFSDAAMESPPCGVPEARSFLNLDCGS
jgi:hypothetical protein